MKKLIFEKISSIFFKKKKKILLYIFFPSSNVLKRMLNKSYGLEIVI